MGNNIAQSKIIFGVTFILLCLKVSHILAECIFCSTTGYACVTDNSFVNCNDGTPDLTAITNCAPNLICSTLGSHICQNKSNSSEPDCKSCGSCDVTKTFACTGERTFALCLGNDTLSDKYTGTCAPDAVCNINNPHICSTDAQVISTCPKEDIPEPTPEPTPAPITDPTAYCGSIQETGRFPMGSNINTTCHQFVSCVLVNEIWRGAIYICPGLSYFDDATRQCTTKPPARCGASVRSISFLDMELD